MKVPFVFLFDINAGEVVSSAIGLYGIDGQIHHLWNLCITFSRLPQRLYLLFLFISHLPVLLYRLKVVPSNFLWTAGGENHGNLYKKRACKQSVKEMPAGLITSTYFYVLLSILDNMSSVWAFRSSSFRFFIADSASMSCLLSFVISFSILLFSLYSSWRALLPGKCKLDDVIELRKKIAEAKPIEGRTEPYVLRGCNH